MTLPLEFFYTLDQASALAAGQFASVDLIDTQAIGPGTNYIQSAIRVYGGTPHGTVDYDVSSHALAEGWVDLTARLEHNVTQDEPFLILQGAANDLLRLTAVNASEHWKVELPNGAGWTQVGATITDLPLDISRKLSVRFKIHDTTGEVIVKVDGVTKVSATGIDTLLTADGTLATIRLRGPSTSSQSCRFQALILDTVETTTLFVDEKIALSNGANTDFIGGEPEIDEYVASPTDTNVISATAPGQNETFNWTAADARVAGYSVEGVMLAARAKATADPGLFLRGIIRSGGVNYDGDNSVQPAAGGFRNNHLLKFANNPATAAAWASVAAADGVEYGFNSRNTA